MPSITKGGRSERRVPHEIAVQLASEKQPLAEMAVTENISPRGARIRSRHSRTVEEHVWLQSLPGDFRCVARVAYCQRISSDEFGVGLHFFEPAGRWVINSSKEPGDSRS